MCCCWRLAAPTGTPTSRSRSEWAGCTTRPCSTGATRPSPSPISTAARSRRCVARSWAARRRSTSWPTPVATAATTTAGRRRVPWAGPMPTCCRISGARNPGRTATTPIVAARAWSAPSSPRRRIRSLTPGSKPRRPQVIRSPRTTTANSRKDSVAASTPSATDDVRRRRVPICGPRRSGRTSRSRPARMRRACS